MDRNEEAIDSIKVVTGGALKPISFKISRQFIMRYINLYSGRKASLWKCPRFKGNKLK